MWRASLCVTLGSHKVVCKSVCDLAGSKSGV